MATLATFLAKVKRHVPDSSARFTDADKDEFTKEAVAQYSRDRPLLRDSLLTGDGTAQSFAVPSDWVDGFSVLLRVEHEIDQIPKEFIDVRDAVAVERQSNLPRILLLSLTLGSAEQARLLYTAPHAVSASASTVLSNDDDAIANLAASFLARALAAFYAESIDPSIDADIVDHAAKATLFTSIADKLKGKYVEHLQQGEVETGVLVMHEQDVVFSWGRNLLAPNHGRRFR